MASGQRPVRTRTIDAPTRGAASLSALLSLRCNATYTCTSGLTVREGPSANARGEKGIIRDARVSDCKKPALSAEVLL